MRDTSLSFGTELHRRRLSAGLSLAGLAVRVHYSKGHLSRVESGGKTPSLGLARRCDAELDAGGELIALVPSPGRRPERLLPPHAERWQLSMSADGGGEFLAAAVAGPEMLSRWTRQEHVADVGGIVRGFDKIFDQLRALGQNSAPSTMVPMLIGNTHALRTLAMSAPIRLRGPVLLTAARYAEYTGWMCQEAADDTAALWWTNTAAEFGAAAGDRDFVPYALVRQALIALYRGDAVSTVEQARAAQRADCSTRVRGLAAQREAQGLALGGDHDGCRRALDRASALLTASDGKGQAIGSWTVDDPVALARGWCLVDLGRPEEAARVIQVELTRIPRSATRARLRFGARLALAYAEAGAVDEACDAIDPVVDALPIVDSATVRNDVRDLSRTLARRHRNARVREYLTKLSAVLNARTGQSDKPPEPAGCPCDGRRTTACQDLAGAAI